MAKIKMDGDLYKRAKAAAEAAGYSGVDEFVTHLVERELARTEAAEAADDQTVKDRLRGLGYVE